MEWCWTCYMTRFSEMALRAIVDFKELPATFLVDGGPWINERSFQVCFEISRGSISAEIPTSNSFEAIQDDDVPLGPIVHIIKKNVRPIQATTPPVTGAKQKGKSKRRGHKCGSQRGRTEVLRRLARSPALEQANATLWNAAKDLLKEDKAIATPQITTTRKILFESIPVDMDNGV